MRMKNLVIIGLIAVAVLISGCTSPSNEVIIENAPNGPVCHVALGGVCSASSARGGTFTTTESFKMAGVDLGIGNTGGYDVTIKVILSEVNDADIPTNILSTGTIRTKNLGRECSWVGIDMEDYMLEGNKKYALYAYVTECYNVNICTFAFSVILRDEYPNGEYIYLYSISNGEDWRVTTSADLQFKIRGTR